MYRTKENDSSYPACKKRPADEDITALHRSTGKAQRSTGKWARLHSFVHLGDLLCDLTTENPTNVTDAPGAALGEGAVPSSSSTSVLDPAAQAGDEVSEATVATETEPVADKTPNGFASGVLADSPVKANQARMTQWDRDNDPLLEGFYAEDEDSVGGLLGSLYDDDLPTLDDFELGELHAQVAEIVNSAGNAPAVSDVLVPFPNPGLVDPFYLVGSNGEAWAIDAVTGSSSLVTDEHAAGIAALADILRGSVPTHIKDSNSGVFSVNNGDTTSAPAAFESAIDTLDHFVQPPNDYDIDPSFDLLSFDLFQNDDVPVPRTVCSRATPSSTGGSPDIQSTQDVLHISGPGPQVYTLEPMIGEAQQAPLDQLGPACYAPMTWNNDHVYYSHIHSSYVPQGPAAHPGNYSTNYQAPGFAPPTAEQNAAYAYFNHPPMQHWGPNVVSPSPTPSHQLAPIVGGPGTAPNAQQYPYVQLQYCNEYNHYPFLNQGMPSVNHTQLSSHLYTNQLHPAPSATQEYTGHYAGPSLASASSSGPVSRTPPTHLDDGQASVPMPSLGVTPPHQTPPVAQAEVALATDLQLLEVGVVTPHQTLPVADEAVREVKEAVSLHPSELLVPVGRITFDEDVLKKDSELEKREWNKMLGHFESCKPPTGHPAAPAFEDFQALLMNRPPKTAVHTVQTPTQGEVFFFESTPWNDTYQILKTEDARSKFVDAHSFKETVHMMVCNLHLGDNNNCQVMVTASSAAAHIAAEHPEHNPAALITATKPKCTCGYCLAAISDHTHFRTCPNLAPWTRWTCRVCLKEQKLDPNHKKNVMLHFENDSHFRGWLGINGSNKEGCRERWESWTANLLKGNMKSWPKAKKNPIAARQMKKTDDHGGVSKGEANKKKAPKMKGAKKMK